MSLQESAGSATPSESGAVEGGQVTSDLPPVMAPFAIIRVALPRDRLSPLVLDSTYPRLVHAEARHDLKCAVPLSQSASTSPQSSFKYGFIDTS